ncbi:hypothetical protein CKO20_07680 [Rhodocyclus tenuis]|nr:hypothetical protein [Rhodocyclus tenuis]
MAAFLLAGLPCSPVVQASPRLHCLIEQNGSSQTHTFAPVSNPYRVAPLDISERFRFKAVVIGDEQHVDYIKLYTYYQTKRRPELLHEVHYRAPVATTAPTVDALSGQVSLYSPDLGREIRYACALREEAP